MVMAVLPLQVTSMGLSESCISMVYYYLPEGKKLIRNFCMVTKKSICISEAVSRQHHMKGLTMFKSKLRFQSITLCFFVSHFTLSVLSSFVPLLTNRTVTTFSIRTPYHGDLLCWDNSSLFLARFAGLPSLPETRSEALQQSTVRSVAQSSVVWRKTE